MSYIYLQFYRRTLPRLFLYLLLTYAVLLDIQRLENNFPINKKQKFQFQFWVHFRHFILHLLQKFVIFLCQIWSSVATPGILTHFSSRVSHALTSVNNLTHRCHSCCPVPGRKSLNCLLCFSTKAPDFWGCLQSILLRVV